MKARLIIAILILAMTLCLVGTACGDDGGGSSPFFLPSPRLIRPMEGAENIGLNPCFRWGSVIGATNYEFRLYEFPLIGDEGFEIADFILGDEQSYCYENDLKLKYNSYYLWSVRGLNPPLELDGEWAMASFFITNSGWEIPQPVEFSGRGDDVPPKFTLVEGVVAFSMTHEGDSNFIIKLLNSSGEYIDLLVNVIGSYSGKRAVGITGDNIIGAEPGDYFLSIEADGEWTIIISYPE